MNTFNLIEHTTFGQTKIFVVASFKHYCLFVFLNRVFVAPSNVSYFLAVLRYGWCLNDRGAEIWRLLPKYVSITTTTINIIIKDRPHHHHQYCI